MSRMMTYYQRRLPHWQMPNRDIFITWRLHGSLPAQVGPQNKIESSGQAFVAFDRALDKAESGALWLKDPRVAESVLTALRMAQKQGMFTLRAYVLMGNHVHVLIEPNSPLRQITQQIKGVTACQANLILGRARAPFWQHESFDHWIRNPAEWQKIRTYIERNPVAAGLVKHPEDWPWSSASRPVAHASACGFQTEQR
jgi:putative transposase